MDTALIQVLEQACSQNPKDLKPAEQTLKQWETERGFYIALYVSRPLRVNTEINISLNSGKKFKIM